MAVPSKTESKEKTTGIARKAGIGTLISLLIIACAFYYFLHVQRRTAYFAARNLRILSTVSQQIVERLEYPDFSASRVTDRARLRWDGKEEEFVEEEAKPAAPAPAGAPRRLTVEQLVAPVFQQSFVDVFDAVMLLDERGNVRWQWPRGVCSATKLDDLKEVRSLGDKEQDLPLASLQHRAFNTQVKLEGREYRLFTQPLPIQPKGGGAQSWVVAGVVTNSRFASQSVTISLTVLVAVLAGFLLVIFSLPFLKLSLVGELQRIRVSDILLLGISLLCFVSIITIVCFDLVAYRRVRLGADAQLRRLASDIKRHMRTEIDLAYRALVALDNAGELQKSTAATLPKSALELPAVRAYPYLESFARIDGQGQQRGKWSMAAKPLDLIPVVDRGYFRTIIENKGWNAERPYVVESIRSRTTGLTQAVMAMRPLRPNKENAVIALAIPMLSLIDTTIAGDCQFAVIDEEGEVLFHSEAQRNNAENFFIETDLDRVLRSAVAARRNKMLDIRYWGDDQRGFSSPIDGTPWTLVTFRNKRLPRTINVETVMITVMFLLFHALAYAIFGAIVAVGRPSYRAPWLWFDEKRGSDYLHLIAAYVCFGIAFAAGIYLFRPRAVLVLATLLPAVVLMLTFMRLKQQHGGPTYLVAAGVMSMVTLVLLMFVWTAEVETDVSRSVLAVRALITAAILGGGVISLLRSREPGKDPVTRLVVPSYLYVAAAAGLLVISAVFPTAAFYKAAFKIEMESFVKHGQLELVRNLEQRQRDLDAKKQQELDEGLPDYANRAVAFDRRKWSNLGVYVNFFASTRVYRNAYGHDTEAQQIAAGDDPLPRFVEWLLPQYSEHSVRIRELLHSRSADDRWKWYRSGDDLVLFSRSMYSSDMNVIAASAVPRLLPRWIGRGGSSFAPRESLLIDLDPFNYKDVELEADPITRVARAALFLTIFIAYAGLILYGAWFVSRKVFLVDLRDPLWLRAPRIGPALGGNVLIFAPDADVTIDRVVDRREVERVSIHDLASAGAGASARWNEVLTRVD
nr:cache domain-containing protein [Acidobacteriota bacterium]